MVLLLLLVCVLAFMLASNHAVDDSQAACLRQQITTAFVHVQQ
jgi:hypothetical protein